MTPGAEMELHWHDYRYFPYEKELAAREASALLRDAKFTHVNGKIVFSGECEEELLRRLVYFSSAVSNKGQIRTVQRELEEAAGNGHKRQSTRYSVHGLHEYKGKFNPQVVRALLNILGLKSGDCLLDPFCGSGTTLVECAHLGISSLGLDLNPLAVYITNAKLLALSIGAERLGTAVDRVVRAAQRKRQLCNGSDERQRYLRSWFSNDILDSIENLRATIIDECPDEASILLTIASNLLRDYSLQDPNDLRIRRRSSPLPGEPFNCAFEKAALNTIERLRQTLRVLGMLTVSGKARPLDICTLPNSKIVDQQFDGAITSPPYATALPYIDTQRLSLVWLNLVRPDEILALDAMLIGSREIRGGRRQVLRDALDMNAAKLPPKEIQFCLKLQNGLGPKDGFRRQATPVLLYRYFDFMAQAFKAIRGIIKKHAPFALIVGSNHTVLNGKRFDIETPSHLVNLALAQGWSLEECLPLQTYHRYGYHVSNAVRTETLILLRNT